MLLPKKLLRNIEIALSAGIIVGLALWVMLVPAPTGLLADDDSVQIDKAPESESLRGASPPCWPGSADRGTWKAPLPSLVRLPSLPPGKGFLAGAVFRLKLVRLHPSIGPPRAFFVERVVG